VITGQIEQCDRQPISAQLRALYRGTKVGRTIRDALQGKPPEIPQPTDDAEQFESVFKQVVKGNRFGKVLCRNIDGYRQSKERERQKQKEPFIAQDDLSEADQVNAYEHKIEYESVPLPQMQKLGENPLVKQKKVVEHQHGGYDSGNQEKPGQHCFAPCGFEQQIREQADCCGRTPEQDANIRDNSGKG
jgi:predicted phage tail protein